MIVQLGKHGDIINVLPYAYMMHKRLGGKIDWLVGKNWASTLEGASYVNPVIWNGPDDSLSRAIESVRGRRMWITQAWMNPDPLRHTDSFAKEQWRYVGAENERGRWPLVFDRRDGKRERKLVDQYMWHGRRTILVGTYSVSTPYRHAARLVDELKALFPPPAYNVIDLTHVRAEKLYDLIALYEAADLLITVDTCHVHLARAAQCPVIALINDGWNGAAPPPQTIAAWRYAELGSDLAPVIAAARNQLGRRVETMAVICNSHDTSSDRHQRALETHPKDMIYCKHDHRPTTKELFGRGLDANKDAVIFTNDDVTFKPDTLDRIKAHLQKFDFGCSRRHEGHPGREIFWFRSDWLRKNWDTLPNVYWSVQKPDLCVARWLRNFRGIPTTLENLVYDFPPVEVPAGLIYHEEHKSNWDNPQVEGTMEGRHNEAVWATMP